MRKKKKINEIKKRNIKTTQTEYCGSSQLFREIYLYIFEVLIKNGKSYSFSSSTERLDYVVKTIHEHNTQWIKEHWIDQYYDAIEILKAKPTVIKTMPKTAPVLDSTKFSEITSKLVEPVNP